jgi:glycerophosphoryl diester phosphodiesterase
MWASKRPLLLGHRGASKYAAENTFRAFDLALQHGCDGFEFDVRYTRDQQCVVCHDAVHRRKRISARRMEELDIPSAEKVILDYASRAFLDVELKVAGDARTILESLAKADAASRYVISSFKPDILYSVASTAPFVRLGLICENPRQLKRWPKMPIAAVMIHFSLASPAVVDEILSAGRQVFVWTVNRVREMERLAALGVDGLISDDTRLLALTLGGALGAESP